MNQVAQRFRGRGTEGRQRPTRKLNSSGSVERAATDAARSAKRFIEQHHRGLTATVALMLAGFAATAFGIAPLMPDAADLPRRIVTESVMPQDIPSQLEALAAHGLDLYRSDTTRASDTADSLLRRLGVTDPTAAAFLRTDAVARKVLEGRAGKMLRVRASESGELEELVVRYGALDPAARGATGRPAGGRARSRAAGHANTPGQWRDPLVALRRDRRGAHSRCGGDAARRGVLGRHRLPPRASQGRHLLGGLRSAHRRRRAGHLGLRGWPRDGGRVRQQRPHPIGDLVPGRTGQGRLLRHRRPQQAPFVPGQPAGVLARDLGLRDAHAPDPAELAAAQRHRLRRTHRHAGAQRRRRRRRLCRLAQRLRQRRRTAARVGTRDRLCTPEPHRRQAGPAHRPGRSPRRRRRHGLGHRAAPALRVQGERGPREPGHDREGSRGSGAERRSAAGPHPSRPSSTRPKRSAAARRRPNSPGTHGARCTIGACVRCTSG
jgi:hypothetical protein